MKKTKVLLIICSFITASVLGQSNSTQIEQLGGFNNANIIQNGYNNNLLIHQVGETNINTTTQNGAGNYVFYYDVADATTQNLQSTIQNYMALSGNNDQNNNLIKQDGNYNEAIIINSGTENSISVSQIGNNNFIDTHNEGDANSYIISQLGNKNQISEDIYANNTNYSISQQGDYNRVIHRDNTISGIDLTITQKGNWIQTVIINGISK